MFKLSGTGGMFAYAAFLSISSVLLESTHSLI